MSAAIVSPVVLDQPWWLAAALAGVVVVLLARRARRRRRVVPSYSVLLQVAAVTAAAVALAGPQLRLPRGIARPYLVLRDVSASTRGQREADLSSAWPRNLPRETLLFASSVAAEGGAIDRNSTRLAPALRMAAARGDDLAGIVIYTDGRFDDDWTAAAATLAAADVTIVPMDSPPADVRIVDFSAAREAVGGRTIHLKLSIAANAPRRRTITVVRSDRPETPVVSRSETPLGPITVRATDSAAPDAAVVYHARLTPGDVFSENDSASLLVLPAEQKVALVAVADEPLVERMLAGARIPVERLSPADAPTGADGWSRYAAVVLVDAKGTLLGEPARRGLHGYVQAGGGLLVLGAGPHATAADRDDPLNRTLPLLANPYDRQPMAVTVVLDASGSMTGRGRTEGRSAVKFDIATDAVMALAGHLTAADTLAVITFSDKARRIYDSSPGPPDRVALHDALAAQRPAGPTNIAPALMQAARTRPPKGKTGLIIVVSDLKTSRFKESPIAHAIQDANQYLAIVATRAAGTPEPTGAALGYLTVLLGRRGRILHSDNLVGLAGIFADFLRDRRGPDVRRGNFLLRAKGSLFATDGGSLPVTTSYILSAAQPGAEVMATIEADPVLARRRTGLGRSVSLALGLGPATNKYWDGSAAAARMLAGALKWCLRRRGDPRFTGRIVRRGPGARFRMDARDENTPINLLDLTLTVSAVSAGRPRRTGLPQVAPGRYEADLDQPDGPFTLRVTDAGGRYLWQGAFSGGYPKEFSALGADWPNLRRLAELTGGRIVPARKIASLSRRWGHGRYVPCWPALAALAAIFMLAEWVTARRWKRWD